MADYRYAYNGPEEGTAKAVLLDAPISTKVSIEISNFLKGKTTFKAKTYLELVMQKKEAMPFKRFTDGVGHKRGSMDAGRYPFKASEHFLKVIKLVEANASQKGLSDDLIIKHLMVHKASTPFHNGRQGRRQMKRSHVEIVVEENKIAKKSKPKSDNSKLKPVPKKEDGPKVKTEKPVEATTPSVTKAPLENKPSVQSAGTKKEVEKPKEAGKSEESKKVDQPEQPNPTKEEVEKPASNEGETQ